VTGLVERRQGTMGSLYFTIGFDRTTEAHQVEEGQVIVIIVNI